ncbi:hypothetical protein BLS_002441 [Venturia inaequalis]|uniref:Acetyl-coenzyme A synthetase n=2 Tax=Venturia inaequalis TaxID=5025 RepID=A0A8H3V9A3_VENIN|nr:hypothetical protein BLS_002441 [Venturia inaequalis]
MSEGDVQPPKGPVVAESHEVDTYHVPKAFFELVSLFLGFDIRGVSPREMKHPHKPHLDGLDAYKQMYKESIEKPDEFWGKMARELLTWQQDFQTVHSGSFAGGDNAWFLEGRLNASYNCVDRHAFKDPNKTAIIYESDEPGEGRKISYGELLREVSRLAYALKEMGVRKGDTVALYLPMIPEAVFAFLACSRIGAVHSVVFAGFSSDSLRDRIIDAESKVVITTDEGKRGGKVIGTKKIVDEALKQCPDITGCLVFKRTGADVPWTKGRDFWWHEEVEKYPNYIAPESMNSEDPLFLLYTSGSTGKPKGVMHTTGGYLLGAAATGKYVFDLHPGDTFFCGGDVGWITGHTYVVYAPLLLGVATVVFEGTPAYPDFSRYWDVVEQYNVSQFYVAPTALRLLKRAGDQHVKHQMKNLRILGSVGEPIASEVWKWYFEVVGKEEAHIVDTYWQTETGSHVITPLGGITPTKPGSASLPFFGIEPAIIDPVSGEEIHGNDVEGVLAFKQPWPSMARTVWGAHKRYMETYLTVYPNYYFTGDGAARDHEGYYWIRGRVDDVVNVSGHRLSTAEIEAALIEHHSVAEAAVVGVSDELTGQAVNAFVALKDGFDHSDQIKKDLILQVRKSIGPFAAPKAIFTVDDLPKTRSGKIMRRILRKILAGEEDQLGDTSTLSDPSVVDKIIEIVQKSRPVKKLVALITTIASLASASSVQRNPLKALGNVLDASINTQSHRITALSSFQLSLSAYRRRIRLHLEPNHDIIAEGAQVHYLGPDGEVARVETIDRLDHKVYKGDAWAQNVDGSFGRVGWARITVMRDGDDPLFEGAFSIDREHHHIQLSSNYAQTRLEKDPAAELTGEDYMIIWRDSDLVADTQLHQELKRDAAYGDACTSDRLDFNMDLEHPVFAGIQEQDNDSWASTPVSALFGKRQLDAGTGAGNSAGVNLVSSIGNTQGCPSMRKVALVGVATDCTYTATFDSETATRQNVINQINSASNLYEKTFNISLGLANLVISAKDCPGTAPVATPWNVNCQSNIDIQARLNLFSAWRGTKNDNYSHWTLLTNCNTGSAVGLAWLGQACVVNADSRNSTSKSGGVQTVAGANVVARTSTEWQVIAHETGHTFGAVHDCTSSTCSDGTSKAQQCCPLSSGTCDAGEKYLMNPSTGQASKLFASAATKELQRLQANSVVTASLKQEKTAIAVVLPVVLEISAAMLRLASLRTTLFAMTPTTSAVANANWPLRRRPAARAPSCTLSCASPEFGTGVCYGLQQNFLDGTECGGGGHCANGQCKGSNFGKEIKSWIDDHKTLVIGISAGVGGLIFLMILSCIYRAIQRKRNQKRFAAQQSAWPAAGYQRAHRGTRNNPSQFYVPSPMQSRGGSGYDGTSYNGGGGNAGYSNPVQQQQSSGPWYPPPPMPDQPYTNRNVRYA